MNLPALIEALTRADAYPAPLRAPVRVLHTHISVLFFADDRVYKVKKPVDLGFLDYRTLERRRHFCAEEVRLNRRLAPAIYLGVVPIARGADGVVRIGGDGAPVEYAVEMVRLPAARMLDARLDAGVVDNGLLDALVDLLTEFHRTAATGDGVDEYGRADEIASQVEENLAGLERFVGDTISRRLFDHLRDHARAWLGAHRDALDARVREGRIREGHGDLHAGNIAVLEDEIVVYDCIEFSRRFRCRDVAGEMAFLAMDLDRRGYRGFAGYLLRRYAEATGDADLPRIAAFHKLHLALVRGLVTSIRATDDGLDDDARRAARAEARSYVHLAASYALPRALVLLCGLPATGKSHAARAIAAPFEAVVLRSDVVRKELAGIPATARGDEALYAPAFTERTYAALLGRARSSLERGATVVVDATFAEAVRRGAFLDLARAAGAPCVVVEIDCPEDVVRERLRARADDAREPSDADWSVYRAARDRFEPPDEVPAAQRVRVDGRSAPDAIAATVMDALLALG